MSSGGEVVKYTEEMKLWLFDLAHGNLPDDEIVKGFIKHYVINGYTIHDVHNHIHFHTNYGLEGAKTAIDSLNEALIRFSERS